MIYLERVVLRPLEEDDLAQLYSFRNDVTITQYLGGFTQGYSLTALRDWLQFHRQQKNEVLWAIALKENNLCIGHIGLYQIDYRVRKAEIGILIGVKQYQGQGLGKATGIAMIRYGFYELNLHKISATVLATNLRSINLFKKLGFQQDGILRDEQFREGRYIDYIVFSCLEQEWRNDY